MKAPVRGSNLPPGTWLHEVPAEYKSPFVETMDALGARLPGIEHIVEGVFRGKDGFPGKALPPQGCLRYVWIPVIDMAMVFGIVISESKQVRYVHFEFVPCDSDDPAAVLSAIPPQRRMLVQDEARRRCLVTAGKGKLEVISTIMRLVVPQEEGN